MHGHKNLKKKKVIVEIEQGVPSVSHEVGFPVSQIFDSTDITE